MDLRSNQDDSSQPADISSSELSDEEFASEEDLDVYHQVKNSTTLEEESKSIPSNKFSIDSILGLSDYATKEEGSNVQEYQESRQNDKREPVRFIKPTPINAADRSG